MFDIGFLELVLIGVLALVVLGPERLPGAARTVGRLAGKARALAKGLQAQLQQEMAAQESQLKKTFGEDDPDQADSGDPTAVEMTREAERRE